MFIRDFYKIANPLCKLLEKEVKFEQNEDCLKEFTLVKALIIITPYRSKPFEIMFDESGIDFGAVLGLKKEKLCHPNTIQVKP